jgi:hypothetical protein
MHTKIVLEKQIEGVLKELIGFGLCTELMNQYRRTYNKLEAFA